MKERTLFREKEPPILQDEAEEMPPKPPPYIPITPPLIAADLHLPYSPLPSIPLPLPDAPEAIVSP